MDGSHLFQVRVEGIETYGELTADVRGWTRIEDCFDLRSSGFIWGWMFLGDCSQICTSFVAGRDGGHCVAVVLVGSWVCRVGVRIGVGAGIGPRRCERWACCEH